MQDSLKKKYLNFKINLIKKNKIFEGKTIVVNRNRIDPVFRSLWCASILSSFKKQKIILFSKKQFSFTNGIYENFGIENFENISIKRIFFKNWIKNTLIFFYSFFVYLVYSIKGVDKFIKEFNFNNIYTGLLIHESYIKKRKYFLDTNFFLPLFYFFNIFNSFILIDFLENYLIKKKIKNIILNKYTYFDIDSIIFLIAKKKNLKCFVLSQEKVLKNYQILFYEQKYSFTKKDLKKKISNIKVNNFVNKKFKGLTDRDSKRAHKQKYFFDRYKLEKLFSQKKRHIVLFCPHVFSDSCSATGKFLYRDYFDYYIKTINILKKIEDINWIIKMHPNRESYNENEVSKKFNDKIKSDNIQILSDKCNTLSVIKNVDAVVTAKGTIILEATALGKKVLAYKYNRFEKCNFFSKYSNEKEYFNKLKFKNFNFKVSRKDRELARKLLYQYSLKAYTTNDNLLKEERNKTKKQLNQYYDNLLKTFKKNKNVIYDSVYYRNLKKKVLSK